MLTKRMIAAITETMISRLSAGRCALISVNEAPTPGPALNRASSQRSSQYPKAFSSARTGEQHRQVDLDSGANAALHLDPAVEVVQSRGHQGNDKNSWNVQPNRSR